MKDRQHNDQKKVFYKTPHRKPQSDHNKPYQNLTSIQVLRKDEQCGIYVVHGYILFRFIIVLFVF